MSRGNPNFKHKFQLCWDCRKSTTGECSWSRCFEPVDGWVAEKMPAKVYKNDLRREVTYSVRECPEFERNSRNGGQERLVESGA